MKHIALASCVVLAAGLALAGCGGKSETPKPSMPTTHATSAMPMTTPAATAPVIAQKICPVMPGNPINPAVYVDYNGRRIYFCCNMCPPIFNKDPEKYIKIVDEQLKAAQDAKPAPR